jgi:tagatose 1,6-diphosphate aldolase GatY/KbaY
MLISIRDLLDKAKEAGYAIGAFNVYNLEGGVSVVQAAQEERSPAILQILPSAIDIGGKPLIRACIEAADSVDVPIAVHLDHCSSFDIIKTALDAGVGSVMADGSHLPFDSNIKFTTLITGLADTYQSGVEAELGKLSGTEDGLSVKEIESRYTNPKEAEDFVNQTGIWALAVCIGNIHGKYHRTPRLDFKLLDDIHSRVSVPLVLHGTSGLPEDMIAEAINSGVCKFNVNTEIRHTYLSTLNRLFKDGTTNPELVEVMTKSIEAMKQPIKEKIRLFGSANKAG